MLTDEKLEILSNYPFYQAYAEKEMDFKRFLENLNAFEPQLRREGFTDEDFNELRRKESITGIDKKYIEQTKSLFLKGRMSPSKEEIFVVANFLSQFKDNLVEKRVLNHLEGWMNYRPSDFKVIMSSFRWFSSYARLNEFNNYPDLLYSIFETLFIFMEYASNITNNSIDIYNLYVEMLETPEARKIFVEFEKRGLGGAARQASRLFEITYHRKRGVFEILPKYCEVVLKYLDMPELACDIGYEIGDHAAGIAKKEILDYLTLVGSSEFIKKTRVAYNIDHEFSTNLGRIVMNFKSTKLPNELNKFVDNWIFKVREKLSSMTTENYRVVGGEAYSMIIQMNELRFLNDRPHERDFYKEFMLESPQFKLFFKKFFKYLMSVRVKLESELKKNTLSLMGVDFKLFEKNEAKLKSVIEKAFPGVTEIKFDWKYRIISFLNAASSIDDLWRRPLKVLIYTARIEHIKR